MNLLRSTVYVVKWMAITLFVIAIIIATIAAGVRVALGQTVQPVAVVQQLVG